MSSETEGRLEAAVRRRIADLEAFILRGKGTWPSLEYVTDGTWDRWHNELAVLRQALLEAGLEQ